MKRGEIWTAELSPRSGSEQQGRRPVLILSNDGFNRLESWKSIIIVPISSSPSQAGRLETIVPVPAGTAGLTRDSVILCHQITTLDRGKFVGRLGELGEADIAAVEHSLKVALDFPI